MVQICVPISGASVADVERQIAQARAEGADLAELRLDLCASAGAEVRSLVAAIASWPLPVMATCRCRDEGGAWAGDEADRLALLLEADARGAALIDVELAALPRLTRRPAHARLVLSYHDFAGMGSDLAGRVTAMRAAGADIAKVAVTPRDAADLDLLATLAARHGAFGDAPGGLIAIGMGEIGLPSRLLAGAWGCALTFARLDGSAGSAPGQPTITQLDRLYRVRSQGAGTCIFGVIGNPVGHSLSPVMHNAAFVHHGLDAVYVPFLVSDAAAFWRACGNWIDGLSITIPHKTALLPLMDRVDDLARDIGAMNTVVRGEDAATTGLNTDAPAAIACLEEAAGTLPGKRVLLLGAGGVSRALGLAMLRAGTQVTVANRTAERGAELARELGCTSTPLDQAHTVPYDILINGTSVGMNQPGQTPWPAALHRAGTVVFDTVYTPLETRLLRDAMAAGASIVCGLTMLERQAALQYQAWTGLQAPLPLMHRRALEALGTRWTEAVCRQRGDESR